MDARRNQELFDRAAAQHGLLRSADFDALEITRSRRRTMVARGVLEPVGRGVWRAAGAPVTNAQRVAAAVWITGGLAAHHTAAALHGLDGCRLRGPVHVLVPQARWSGGSTLAVVHTSRVLTSMDRVEVDGIACTSIPRTLLSLAADPGAVPWDRLCHLVDRAVADRQASDSWLWWYLERTRREGLPGIRRLERALAQRLDGGGTEGWLEWKARAVFEAAGLPAPRCQARIRRRGAFLARVDFAFDGTPVVVEVSGHRWHRTAAQMAEDARRRRELTLAGRLVLEFTYDDIVQRPAEVVATIRAALAPAAWGPWAAAS